MIIAGIIICGLLIIAISVFLAKKRTKKKVETKEKQAEEKTRKEEEERRVYDEYLDFLSKNYREKYDYLNDSLLARSHYFAFSEMESFVDSCKDLIDKYSYVATKKVWDEESDEDLKNLYYKLKDIENVRKEHNRMFVGKELDDNKEFFDTALNYPLDMQQRESIVKLEDNCLVISSAGSGKTSTMIGKLLYLTHIRKIQPARILTISYTHKAADELSQRLLGTGLTCITFHKLAMNIVSKVEGAKPSFADQSLFVSVFNNQLKSSVFREAILNYLTDYKSCIKNEHEYNSSVEYYADRKKYGIIALYTDKDGRLIATKSEEEKKICSYLSELGVSFKYEEPYLIHTMTEDYRQYKPDFTIYYKDDEGNNKVLYLEHFAINSSKQVPKWFGTGIPDGWHSANQRYLEGIEWKKNLHRNNNTKLVWTTSADFHSNTIRERLRNILEAEGVPIKPLSKDELLEKVLSRNKSAENALLQLTQSFINLVKANGKNIDEVRAVAESKHSQRDVFVIDNIMRPLWDEYNSELKKRGEMDFTDAIILATKYCNEGKWNQKYDYILIDEFQDISVDRYKLLLSLRTDLPKTKLYCVGDDWQSIYRFSGSDMSLFAEFSKYFGYTEECKIETTYRFGNPLINESSRFVQSNPIQKRKNVKPRQVKENDIAPETKISFMPYRDKAHLQKLVEQMAARVPDGKSLYIISRYTYDVKDLVCPRINMFYNTNDDTVTLKFAGRNVKFMSIHGSKGLEADYVFMLNCNCGLYGFPSLVSDDPVLDYVLSEPEHYEYAEERRVYYVGITRAKVHTVVLYDENSPSPFVCEMDKSVNNNQDPCPLCGTGHRIMKYQGWTKNKKQYRVWGCDNRQANCQYYEREFLNEHDYKNGVRFFNKGDEIGFKSSIYSKF